jgi:hypothetical protein
MGTPKVSTADGAQKSRKLHNEKLHDVYALPNIISQETRTGSELKYVLIRGTRNT